MTRQDYFISKTNLIAQIESAKKFGCKNVLKCAKLNLAELEKKYKEEHLSNPLFSYMVTDEEMNELIRNDEKPTFKIKVTFKSGEAYDLMFYHELKSGVKHSDVVEWAMKGLVKTIYHPENIVNARFIMGQLNRNMSRQEYNLKILDIIKAKAQEYPDMRFHQLLWAFGATVEGDQFYEESEVTLNRILETLRK